MPPCTFLFENPKRSILSHQLDWAYASVSKLFFFYIKFVFKIFDKRKSNAVFFLNPRGYQKDKRFEKKRHKRSRAQMFSHSKYSCSFVFIYYAFSYRYSLYFLPMAVYCDFYSIDINTVQFQLLRTQIKIKSMIFLYGRGRTVALRLKKSLNGALWVPSKLFKTVELQFHCHTDTCIGFV